MRAIAIALAGFLAAAPAFAHPKESDLRKLDEAGAVLKEIMSAPDRGIPQDLLERAECVGVFPDVKKGAFFVGGQGGRGVFTCRQKDGSMGAPAFFKIGGGSIGWQFGGQEADMVLLITNPNGVDHLLRDRFTIGAEGSATAGPVGRTVKAATDAQLHAQILSWSRSRGAFLGASLDGTAIWPDADANEGLYGRKFTAREVLVDGAASVPADARSLVATVNRYARRK